MIHITAAIGLALTYLLKAILWSIAPIASVVVIGLSVVYLAVILLERARRR